MKYVKKPVVIEAQLFSGTLTCKKAICAIFPALNTVGLSWKGDNVSCWEISTLEGKHRVSTGDYVIKGIKGEFYPCKPDIFELTYDAWEPSNDN